LSDGLAGVERESVDCPQEFGAAVGDEAARGSEGGGGVEEQYMKLFEQYAKRFERLKPSSPTCPVLWTATDPAHGRWNTLAYERRFRDPSFTSSGTQDHSIAVFPERQLLHGILPSSVGSVALALSSDAPLIDTLRVLAPEVRVDALPGLHVVVCVHHTRNENCASCGTSLLRESRHAVVSACGAHGERATEDGEDGALRERITKAFGQHGGHGSRAGDDSIALWTSSCLGEAGDNHGGNAIVYPSGDWFGQIGDSEDDARRLLAFYSTHYPSSPSPAEAAGAFLNHWRGRVGLSGPDQLAAFQAARE
jgi:hypothetical protein